jgi:sigma-B regulation protein RsbU (phosphoserine phosphatase)
LGLRVAHLFKPAEDIGGDYYDILPLKDGAWLICVADVTGHGIPAAMSAAMLKTLLL